MKTVVVSFGLLIAFAACRGGDSKGIGSSAAKVTAGGTANLGDACGGGDPSAALCDESKNLYCQQDPDADPSAPGTCGSCGDLGATSLVCNDGTIQPGQWVAVDQTCQIIGCGQAQSGEPCDNTAADPTLTCAYPLVCTQATPGQDGVCADGSGDDAGAPTTTDDAGTGDDASSLPTDDAGSGEDADPTSTGDVDAGVATSDDAGTGDTPEPQRAPGRPRGETLN